MVFGNGIDVTVHSMMLLHDAETEDQAGEMTEAFREILCGKGSKI